MQRVAISVLSLILIATSTAAADRTSELAALLPNCGYVCVDADPTADAESLVLPSGQLAEGHRTTAAAAIQQLWSLIPSGGDSSTNAAFRLILCDTAEQIERVFTLYAEERTFDAAIDAVNKQARKHNACSKATVKCGFRGNADSVPVIADS